MSLEKAVNEVLRAIPALAGFSIRPNVADSVDKPPYVVFRNIVGSRPQTLGGDCGLANGRMQIDVYAETVVQTSALKTEIRKGMLAATEFSAVFLNEGAGVDPATKLHRYRQDFSVWLADDN